MTQRRHAGRRPSGFPAPRPRTRVPWRWPWLLGAVLGLAVSGVWFVSSWDREGGRAPAFTLPSAAGDMVSLEPYLGRSPVVLVFYTGDL